MKIICTLRLADKNTAYNKLYFDYAYYHSVFDWVVLTLGLKPI